MSDTHDLNKNILISIESQLVSDKTKLEECDDSKLKSNETCGCKESVQKKTFIRYLRIPLIIFATIATFYVCVLSSERYLKVWVMTAIESTDLHISEIPFPAVTICPMKIGDINKSNSNSRTIENISSTDKENFKQFSHMVFNFFDSSVVDAAASYIDTLPSLSLYDTVFLSDLFGFADYSCEELFDQCSWRFRNISCCDLFVRWPTPQGTCYTFNSNFGEQLESSSPWSVARAGPMSGLRVLLNRKINGQRLEKVALTIHEFDEYVSSNIIQSSADRIIVPIEPIKFEADYDITARPLYKRNCRFKSETYIPYQRQSDCMLKCHLRYITRRCNCTYLYQIPMPIMELFFDDEDTHNEPFDEKTFKKPTRNCQVYDLPCFYENRQAIITVGNIIEVPLDDVNFTTYNCRCYPECNRVQYNTAPYTDSISDNYRDMELVEVQVYFQQDTLISYGSILRFTILDLIVSFGGIAGLFLGFSMISLFDVLLNFLNSCRRLSCKWRQQDSCKRNKD